MTDAIPEIQPADAAALVDGGHALLVDVREPEEWEAGHAPQAKFMPLSTFVASALADAGEVVVVCRAGGRSAVATQMLLAEGISAKNLVGGMGAWQQQGLPVQRNDGTPGDVI